MILEMEKDSKIFVAGHRGMVGSAIVRELRRQGYVNIITRTHAGLDLTDQRAVEEFFAAERPEYVFLAAAKVGGIVANSKAPADFMYVNMMLEMNVINAAGNAILIFGLHMGVEGVAIPTVVSRVFAAAAMLILLRRPGLALQVEKLSLRHDPYIVKNILRFGVTNGLESSMFQLGKILLLSTVSVLGTASVAANAIGNSLATFQCVAGNALGLGIVTVVSQCVGAGDYGKARFYTKKLLKTAYISMDLCILLVYLAMPLVLRLYNVSPEAEHYARQIVWMHGFMGMLFWPLSFTLPQALRAAGDTRFTMVVSSVSMCGWASASCWGGSWALASWVSGWPCLRTGFSALPSSSPGSMGTSGKPWRCKAA